MKSLGLSAIAGVLAGTAAAVFLILLDLATKSRDAHPEIIWFLPLAGFVIGWIYWTYGGSSAKGNNLIIDEIHDPKNVLPPQMSPFVLLGTVITHLFGGSAGREGTAVQMGASLSDQMGRFFRVTAEERKILLTCGAGAGFGAAIGAPWAGVIFGMEVVRIGGFRPFAVPQSFIASFIAYGMTRLLHAPHTHYPEPDLPGFDIEILFYVILAGAAFGLCARAFTMATHFVENNLAKFVKYPPLKPALAGLAIVLLYRWEGSYRYAGLGLSVIQDSFLAPASFTDPAWKGFFTALTVGSGFKGGEFIPLVFMGATLGSALGLIFPVSFSLLTGLGFAAVFAGAANTPLACTVMAMELFGPRIGLYALVACTVSYLFSSHNGIYHTQRTDLKKHRRVLRNLKWVRDRFISK